MVRMSDENLNGASRGKLSQVQEDKIKFPSSEILVDFSMNILWFFQNRLLSIACFLLTCRQWASKNKNNFLSSVHNYSKFICGIPVILLTIFISGLLLLLFFFYDVHSWHKITLAHFFQKYRLYHIINQATLTEMWTETTAAPCTAFTGDPSDFRANTCVIVDLLLTDW